MQNSTASTDAPPEIQVFRAGKVVYGHTEGAGTPEGLARELSRCLGPGIPGELFWLTQEHTAKVVPATKRFRESVADGFILNVSGTLGIIRTADCTPLFFWSDSQETAGLVHVGWRGLAGGIVTNLLDVLERQGTPAAGLNVWLGPAIEGGCYPVGSDLPGMFPGPSKKFWGFSRNSAGQWTLDVRSGIMHALQKAGVPARRISRSPVCTFCESQMPSYRRQGSGCGRLLNFIFMEP